MKAAYLYGKEDIRVESMEIPEVEDHGLLIRVLTCGICGSDSRAFFNGPSSRYSHPAVLGHELSGEIVQVGSSVQDYEPGDLITLAPIIPCMRCTPCSKGQDNICENAKVVGVNFYGGFAEYLYIPSQMVQVGGAVKLPEGIHHREAALAELVGCCLHGLRQMGIEAGDSVLVIGGGPIGMTFIQLARLMGAQVISSEPLERRREMAIEMGAVEAIDPTKVDLKAHFGYSFDRVIIATASVAATEAAFDLPRAGGSLLMFSGYLKGSAMDMQLNDVHYRELHIHGSIDSTIRDFQNAVHLLPQLKMDRLITACYPLERIVEAFYATRDPNVVKNIIEP